MNMKTLENNLQLAFGTYRLQENICYISVLQALRIGYRIIDTADLYKNHKYIGLAIKDSGIRRNEIFIITKIHNRNQKENNVYDACNRLLEELNMDYIDLILLHTPIKNKIIESWQSLILAKQNRITRYIGVSNFNIENLSIILEKYLEMPYVNQIECNIYNQRTELIQYCQTHDIIVQAHSCLANCTRMNGTELIELCQQYQFSFSHINIMLWWCIKAGLAIIVNSTNNQHLIENFSFYHEHSRDIIPSDGTGAVIFIKEREFLQLDEKYTLYKHEL